MLDVDDVGQFPVAEPQHAEAARDRMPPDAVRHHLKGEVGALARLQQVGDLVLLSADITDRPLQRGLLDDHPELKVAAGEAPLPFLADQHVPFRVFGGEVAKGQNSAGVILGLQQAGHELRLVDTDGCGGLLHAHISLEPLRQDVGVPVPPARPVRLLGQAQQLLPLGVRHAVVGQQVKDVDFPDGIPAQLDAADLRFRPADDLGGLLSRDSPAFTQATQMRAEEDAKDGRSMCRLRHQTHLSSPGRLPGPAGLTSTFQVPGTATARTVLS